MIHVAVKLGSGVEEAVHHWIESTAHDFEHVVIATAAKEFGTRLSGAAGTSTTVHGDLGRLVRTLRSHLSGSARALVHAHSSRGGALVRVAVRQSQTPIVYSPHCFAFERKDVRSIVRQGWKAAERTLVRRTVAVVAVSRREADLAEALGHRRVCIVPPTLGSEGRSRSSERPRTDPRVLTVVGVGRLAPQKDPKCFAEVARLCSDYPVHFTWVGSGSDDLRDELVRSGVRVTGWLPADAATDLISQSDVLLHTAQWEGMPVVVEEALLRGVPVVARDIPAVRELGAGRLGSDAMGLARHVISLASSSQSYTEAAIGSAQAGHVRRDAHARGLSELRALYHGLV